MDQAELLRRVKQTVHEVEPEAEIVLYGSRSRQEAGPESDWDFLVLVDGPVDDARTDAIRHRLYEIEWESWGSPLRRRAQPGGMAQSALSRHAVSPER